MQTTLWVIPVAFVDDVLHGHPFSALLTRGVMEVMIMKLVMVKFSALLLLIAWVRNMQMTL
jgi:hypothetical protein